MLCRPPRLPEDKGTYLLVLEVKAFHAVRFTRSHKPRVIVLREGMYVYVGSAFSPGGLRARVQRHITLFKKSQWHIDRLVSSDLVKPVCIAYCVGKRLEEAIASAFTHLYEPQPYFGASDDRVNTSHLFRLPRTMRDNACWLMLSHLASRCERVGLEVVECG